MIIKSDRAGGSCDLGCGHPATHAAVAQGATGRWCEVMWICEPAAIKWAGGDPDAILTAEQARMECEKRGSPAEF